MNFFAELKRRHIYRVAAAYAVVAWVLLQLANNVAPALRIPDWGISLVLVLLVIGLPIVLIFAWVRELAPADGSSPATTGKLDWVLIGALTAVLLAVSYQQLALSPGTQTSEQAQASGSSVRAVANSPATAISVAVLPFTNLSSEKEQDFFSDGMTEEITSALAKVPDLRVVGRTSAFQFKGENKDLRAIGQALNATHLIEGSVRKAGDRLRITAQLIKADDGTHIWAENYDRELTDVFAIQEDIARAITASLNMSLGLKTGEQLVANRAIDPVSYEQFLRGRAALLRARSAFADQLAFLEPVTVKNPNYAPGWTALAQAYRYAAQFTRYGSPEETKVARAAFESKMRDAARRAVELDPNSVDGKVLLARIQSGPRRVALSEDLLSKALVLDPSNANALDFYGNLLLAVGRIREAVAMKQRVNNLEPYSPVYNGNFAQALWLDGQTDAAIALWKDNLAAEGAGAELGLAQIYASLGRYGDASGILSQMAALERNKPFRAMISSAAMIIRSAPEKVAAPEKLPRLGGGSLIYLYVGAPERALEPYLDSDLGFNDVSLLWHPTYAPLRKMEGFKQILRKAGLVEYWRERGWPALCHPTIGDDFACS